MICCTVNPGSRIVNPVGRVLKFMDMFTRQLTHTLELDYEVLHLDRNMNHLDEMRQKYGKEIDVDWVEAEGMMMLSSTGPTPLNQIMKDLDFRSARTYFELSINAIANVKREDASPVAVSTK
jgi:hypothetical protein